MSFPSFARCLFAGSNTDIKQKGNISLWTQVRRGMFRLTGTSSKRPRTRQNRNYRKEKEKKKKRKHILQS